MFFGFLGSLKMSFRAWFSGQSGAGLRRETGTDTAQEMKDPPSSLQVQLQSLEACEEEVSFEASKRLLGFSGKVDIRFFNKKPCRRSEL